MASSKGVAFIMVFLLIACTANKGYGDMQGSCSNNVGQNIQDWFKKLGSLSQEISSNCYNLPQADKVKVLETELNNLRKECQSNASLFQLFIATFQRKFADLDGEVTDLKSKMNRDCSSVRKIENGLLVKNGNQCRLTCSNGTYPKPASQFLCDESYLCANDKIQCLAADSCKAIKANIPNAKSRIYTIFDKQNSRPYDVYCDMTTDNGGWTLVAIVANGDGNNWAFRDGDRDFGDATSLWENALTLGSVNNATIKTALDFKSKSFLELGANELLISFKGRSYIQTDGDCLGGHSLKNLLNILRFSCAGSSYNCYYGKCLGTGGTSISNRCDHSCNVKKFYQLPTPANDPLSNGKLPVKVLIKTGEAEGAQDGNKDRVYISTFPYRDNVDYVNGLGTFTSLSGNIKNADISIRDDVSKESPDRSLFYGLLVR